MMAIVGSTQSKFQSACRMRMHGALLLALTLLFTMRVLGQAIQRWTPHLLLPPFDAFQGSGLPYGLLLAAQLVLLMLMVWYATLALTGRLRKRRRTGIILTWIGGAYLTGSLARIVIGLAIPTAPAWFTAWIPAAFHVVLAAYVLVLGSTHRQPMEKSLS